MMWLKGLVSRRDEDSAISMMKTVRYSTREELNRELPFGEFISNREEVLISGLTLVSTIAPYLGRMKQEIEKGTHFQFLLLPPDFPCLAQIAILHNVSAETLLNDINAALTHIKVLIESISPEAKGSVRYRYHRTIPSCSIVMRDGHKKSGAMRCELFVHKLGVNERPVLELTDADGMLFRAYRESIKKTWDESPIGQ